MPSAPKIVECYTCKKSIWFDWSSKPGDPGRSAKTLKMIPLQVNVDAEGKAEFIQESHKCTGYNDSADIGSAAASNSEKPAATAATTTATIPHSGPETWEQKIGLLNGQVFMRMDKFDQDFNKVMKELTAAIDRTEARLNQIVAALDEMKEDNL